MPAATATVPPPSVLPDEPHFLPAEAFFVRRVAVDAAADVATQVEIALEAGAPFGAGQLYYGYLPAAGGAHALVFATHRRLFAAEGWDGAAVVLPGFAALLGSAPTSAAIRLWFRAGAVVAAAWDGASDLPAHVLARATDDAAARTTGDELVRELARRLGQEAPVTEWTGEPVVTAGKNDAVEISLSSGGRRLELCLERPVLEAMDVRDKVVLAERRRTQRRDTLLWRVLQGSLAAIGLALLLEAGMVAGRVLVRQQREAEAQAAPEVERIQTAQALSTRIEEMSQRRLRPFEMLAVLNTVRPPGVVYSRAATVGQGGIEIEAQTAVADNVGAFESALKALPAVESAEARDLRLREGLTTFQITVRFREGSLAAVAGEEAAK